MNNWTSPESHTPGNVSVEGNTDYKLAVDVRNVFFEYKKKVPILKDISIQIPKGKIYALLGSNGCGKTTLLRLVMGLLKPKSGCVEVFGKEPNSKYCDIPGSGVGYMPQEIALFNEFTIGEILKYFGIIYDIKSDVIEKRIQHLIELLRLPKKDTKIGQLSGGQQRLVSIAVTMIHRPPLLILDEPTVGVDSLLKYQIWTYLENICRNEDITVIITTHYIEETRTSSIVGFMRFGVLLTQSNPNDLLIKYNCNKLEDVFLELCQQSINRRKDSKAIEKIFEVEVQKVDKTSKIITNNSAKDSKKIFDPNRMKALIWKSYIRVKRNPFVLVLFHFIPIVIIVLMVLCFARLPHSFPVAVYNGEQEPNLSKLFIEQINKKLIQINYHNTNESAFTSVVKGKSWYAISFEKNFSESFRIRVLEPEVLTDEELEYSNIKLYADNSNAFAGLHIYEYLQVSLRRFLEKFSTTLGFSPLAFSIPVFVEEPVYGKNELLFYETLAPGILVGTFHLLPMIFAAFLIVIERRDGHIDRALVAGIKPFEILLTHIITIFIAIISSVLLSMLVAFVILNMSSKGPVIDVFGLLLMQGLQGMSFGLFISFVVLDVQYVSTFIMGLAFSLWFTSGMLWPLESVPSLLQMIFYWNPLTIPIESMRSVMIRGWGSTHTTVLFGYLISITYTSIVMFINFFLSRTHMS